MAVKPAKLRDMEEISRARFVRIVERRVNTILDNLDSLGKCSNRKNYDYSDKDVKIVFGEIEKKVKEIKGMFRSDSKNKNRFRLGN